MLIIGQRVDTLPEVIAHDASTGLPLLSEADAVMKIVLAYQALPYSVAEYGCGKKCSLIIDQLIKKGIPPWALKRGLCLERDMSPAALGEEDYDKRKHSLTVDNPLSTLGDLEDPVLHRLLEAVGAEVDIDQRVIKADVYRLDMTTQVQFAKARSHVFTILTFWDDKQRRSVERVIDPTLDLKGPFVTERIREYLKGPESLIFDAPLLAHFRLDATYLTETQRAEIEDRIGARPLDELPLSEHNQLVRDLTGAKEGSIGDPETWTYANNLHGPDEEHTRSQREATGDGDPLREAVAAVLKARNAHDVDVARRRDAVQAMLARTRTREMLRIDAQWSRRQLEPLAEVALNIVYHNSLEELARAIDAGQDVGEYLATDEAHEALRGLGVRLRHRIDRLALVSMNEEDQIDARALNAGFLAAAVETARQMNEAGLAVCVDKVGNLHGLFLDDKRRRALAAGDVTVAELASKAITHGSHIDTVADAGKFDGRLGVAAGIETARLIRDLDEFYGARVAPDDGRTVMIVSAYVNEEMTFTGEGVSMSGSAAVAGRAGSDRVHRMENREGERYGDRLDALLQRLRNAADHGAIELMNRFGSARESLVDACWEPADFYTPHHFERHIEQGPVLDRSDVPVVLVDTIMGIHQEDFVIRGEAAERAALELGAGFRELVEKPDFQDLRITVGIMEPLGETRCHALPAAAFRCEIEGERNHAGSIAMADRQDAGVAAGYLARRLVKWASDHDRTPLVGDLSIEPGINRNVIPGGARVTLAIAGDSMTDEHKTELCGVLEAFAARDLAADSEQPGAGLHACRIEPASFLNTAETVCMSIDLRGSDAACMDAFRDEIDNIVETVGKSHDVRIKSSLEQRLDPSHIEQTGQVLLMERSYGGSHNPNENELSRDLTRGCILQFMVTRDVLSRPDLEGLNLVECTQGYIPERWLERRRRFVSGALHDTCNISARAFPGKLPAEIHAE